MSASGQKRTMLGHPGEVQQFTGKRPFHIFILSDIRLSMGGMLYDATAMTFDRKWHLCANTGHCVTSLRCVICKNECVGHRYAAIARN
jgi:hypothetical protein